MTSLDDAFDRILAISLPTSHQRRKHIEDNFRQAGIGNYEFLDAIDGRELPVESWRRSRFVLPDSEKRHALASGRVGCALSHSYAYCLMLSRGYDNVLICEDDVAFDERCHETVDLCMAQMPEDWDIIHFYSSRPEDHPFSRRRRRIADKVYVGFNEGASAACYAITRRCARYLLSIRFPINTSTDGIINWPTGWWTSGYNGYVVRPNLCSRVGLPSEIRARP